MKTALQSGAVRREGGGPFGDHGHDDVGLGQQRAALETTHKEKKEGKN